MKLTENSIVKLISKESLLHVVKNVQILSLGYVKTISSELPLFQTFNNQPEII